MWTLSVKDTIKPRSRGGGGYSCELLVGVCRPVFQMLILFHGLYQGVPPGYKEQITRKLRKKYSTDTTEKNKTRKQYWDISTRQLVRL